MWLHWLQILNCIAGLERLNMSRRRRVDTCGRDILEVGRRLADFDWLGWVARIFSAVALIPYFGWGIHTLRLRLRYHEDITPPIEAATLLGVALFYAFELFLLRASVGYNHAYFFFAVLGLLASGAALYGPMAASLLSQVMVDAMMPGERSPVREPRFEPAEALERQDDYEGALREYLVMARIFPREPAVLLRIADCYVKLSQPNDAVSWFERALPCLTSPEESLRVTNRLCEIYNRQLDRPHEVNRLLAAYLERYPDAEYAGSIRDRLARLGASV